MRLSTIAVPEIRRTVTERSRGWCARLPAGNPVPLSSVKENMFHGKQGAWLRS